jgi:hypothetical protein
MAIRCQVNWQPGVNLGVIFGAIKSLDDSAVPGRFDDVTERGILVDVRDKDLFHVRHAAC